MQKVYNSFDTQTFDFNELTKLLSSGHYQSLQSSKYLDNYILQGTVVLKDVHTYEKFHNLINKVINHFNLFNKKITVDLYLGFTPGASSNIHKDKESVYLYNLQGEVIYTVNNEKYVLKEKDLLYVPANVIHQAIGITSRITLSLGVYD